MSKCPQAFFCRVHGMFDTFAGTARRSRRAYSWGLLAALGIASAHVLFPATIDSQAAVAWSAVWIAAFPLLSRSATQQTLFWSMLAASATPLAWRVAAACTQVP